LRFNTEMILRKENDRFKLMKKSKFNKNKLETEESMDSDVIDGHMLKNVIDRENEYLSNLADPNLDLFYLRKQWNKEC